MHRLFFAFLITGLFAAPHAFAQATPEPHAGLRCEALQAAFDQYAYAEYAQATALLNALPDASLPSEACKSEKYMLLGAMQVVAYMMKETETLDAADQRFRAALVTDPFRRMGEDLFPPRLIRNRFEYNRTQLKQGDLQTSVSERLPDATKALQNASHKAMHEYVGQFFSPERFIELASRPEVAQPMLSTGHIKGFQTERTEQDSMGVLIETLNLIDRQGVLRTANQKGILFDIEKPYVRLDITETIDGTPSQSRIALTGIKQALNAAGFTVIDETMPNTEAHILVRGNVDASSEQIGMGMGWGGFAISNLTMRWADGSNYEFGSQVEKKDGKGKMSQREASFSALENLSASLAGFIKQTCLEEWNNRTINGAIHLIELEGNLSYEDFRRVLTQLSTFALNDPLDNPRYVINGRTQIYVRHRPQDGDLADIIRREGFYNLSRKYTSNITQVSFNHIVLNVTPE